MDLENQKRLKRQQRREGHNTVFKANGQSFMLLNKKTLEKINGPNQDILAFLA